MTLLRLAFFKWEEEGEFASLILVQDSDLLKLETYVYTVESWILIYIKIVVILNAVDFVYMLLCMQLDLLSLMWLYQANTSGLLVCGASLPKRDRVSFAEHRQLLWKNQEAVRVCYWRQKTARTQQCFQRVGIFSDVCSDWQVISDPKRLDMVWEISPWLLLGAGLSGLRSGLWASRSSASALPTHGLLPPPADDGKWYRYNCFKKL